jgi:hypothetical protein
LLANQSKDICGTRLERLVPVLTILGFLLPVVAYFWLIHEYAVNILWLDQWGDVYVIFQTHSHSLDLSALWAQHTENRIFFPNLIVVLLAHTTHSTLSPRNT